MYAAPESNVLYGLASVAETSAAGTTNTTAIVTPDDVFG